MLKIQILPNGPRLGGELKDHHPIILGRETMPGLPPAVSGRHIEILPYKDKLLLRHVGSNPTLIQKGRKWYQLKETWLTTAELTKLHTVVLAACKAAVGF